MELRALVHTTQEVNKASMNQVSWEEKCQGELVYFMLTGDVSYENDDNDEDYVLINDGISDNASYDNDRCDGFLFFNFIHFFLLTLSSPLPSLFRFK